MAIGTSRMDKLKSLYLGQNDKDDIGNQVLDNYLIMFRHMMGKERLFVKSKIRPTLPSKPKELWRKKIRICERCQIEYYPYHYGQKFCGSQKTKEGCAWIRRVEGLKKSRIKRREDKFFIRGSKYKL